MSEPNRLALLFEDDDITFKSPSKFLTFEEKQEAINQYLSSSEGKQAIKKAVDEEVLRRLRDRTSSRPLNPTLVNLNDLEGVRIPNRGNSHFDVRSTTPSEIDRNIRENRVSHDQSYRSLRERTRGRTVVTDRTRQQDTLDINFEERGDTSPIDNLLQDL